MSVLGHRTIQADFKAETQRYTNRGRCVETRERGNVGMLYAVFPVPFFSFYSFFFPRTSAEKSFFLAWHLIRLAPYSVVNVSGLSLAEIEKL